MGKVMKISLLCFQFEENYVLKESFSHPSRRDLVLIILWIRTKHHAKEKEKRRKFSTY